MAICEQYDKQTPTGLLCSEVGCLKLPLQIVAKENVNL